MPRNRQNEEAATALDLATMRIELLNAEAKLQATKQAKPVSLPEIVKASVPVVWRVQYSCWYVYFPIHTSLKEVWYKNLVWRPTEPATPFSVALGLPIRDDGSYLLSNVCVLTPRTFMPHIDSMGGCLDSVNIPKTLKTLEDYEKLYKILHTHCEGMQIDSLYTSSARWPNEIIEALPASILRYAEDPSREHSQAMAYLFEPDSSSNFFQAPPAEPPTPQEEESQEDYEETYEENECNCADCRAFRERQTQQAQATPEPASQSALDIWTA